MTRKLVGYDDFEFVYSKEQGFEIVFHNPEWETTKDL